MNQVCPCCQSESTELFKLVNEYCYYKCAACNSIFIDTAYLAKIDNGFNIVKYEQDYWRTEMESARQRSYGPALARMSEAIYYCKRPINKFLDIGTGPGFFLDAVAKLLPDNAHIFYGVELYPPEPEFRSKSKNYIVDDLGNLEHTFDCGICIEVIEHVTPKTLGQILKKLATISNPNALYIFNTGMPEFVINEDIGYLDPTGRGHIVSYSHQGVSCLAGKYGFTVHRIIGKTWAFALEFSQDTNKPPEDIRDRIWTASEHNLNILSDRNMGDVLKILGLETSRAYN
jgi:SAM-dependent methyltransferase